MELKIEKYLVIIIIITLFFPTLLYCYDLDNVLVDGLDGENVCESEEYISYTTIHYEKISYREYRQVWCFAWPPRCTETNLLYRTVKRETPSIHVNIRKICCDGYIRVGTECLSHCTNNNNTTIIVDGNKECHFDIPLCKPWLSRLRINDVCKFSQNSYSFPGDDECYCHLGWEGDSCDSICKICPPGFYGENCTNECDCKQNNSICNPVYGCVCMEGYEGKKCEIVVNPESSSQDGKIMFVLFVTLSCVFIIYLCYAAISLIKHIYQ